MKWFTKERSRKEATLASHPGCVNARPLYVAGSYPFLPAMLASGWLLSLAAVFDGFHWGAWLLLAMTTYLNYVYWKSIKPWFRLGDTCAGVVVSEKPLLIASYTDLRTGDDFYPAVKIRREPARRFSVEAAKYGKKVASIARYDPPGYRKPELWNNFHPRAVQCATDDPREVQRLLGEIRPERWALLQQAVKRLPRPFRPGLYRLTGDG